MDDLQKGMITETTEFNKFLRGCFITPETLEDKLSEIQARVAVLTKGWYGTNDDRCTAREEFNIIMLRFTAITFFIRQMKEALKAKTATKEQYDLIITAVKDKKLEKQIREIQANQPVTEYDPIAKEAWDAIVLNLGLRLERAVYTGIENRMRKEAEAHEEAEKLRAQNAGFLLGEALKSMGDTSGFTQ